MKINNLIEFEGNYFLILSDPFILEGKKGYFPTQVIKVVDLSKETIDLLEVKYDGIKNKVHWIWISFCQILSESLIKEFQNKVWWDYISYYQTLSESFIREFQDKVHWGDISFCQVLSEPFIKEFQDKVNWSYIFHNKNISSEIKEKFRLEGKFN